MRTGNPYTAISVMKLSGTASKMTGDQSSPSLRASSSSCGTWLRQSDFMGQLLSAFVGRLRLGS